MKIEIKNRWTSEVDQNFRPGKVAKLMEALNLMVNTPPQALNGVKLDITPIILEVLKLIDVPDWDKTVQPITDQDLIRANMMRLKVSKLPRASAEELSRVGFVQAGDQTPLGPTVTTCTYGPGAILDLKTGKLTEQKSCAELCGSSCPIAGIPNAKCAMGEELMAPAKKCNCFDCRGDAKFFDDAPENTKPQPTAIDGHGIISCPYCFKPVLNDVKPLADKGLVEELKKWCKDRNSCTEFSVGQDFAKDDVLYIISRYSPQESIAELADRKGYYISRQMNRFKDTKAEWIINLEPSAYEYSPKWFAEIAYTDCEAKARQYLEGLPDRKEGEK